MKKTSPVLAALSLLTIFGALSAHAELPSAVKRLDFALDPLIATYAGRTDFVNLIEIGTGDAVNSGQQIRQLLFRVESLFNLYKDDFPQLKQPLKQIKNLEDHIGHYQDAKDFLADAMSGGAPADQIAKFKQRLEAEKAQYIADIQGWGGAGTVPKNIQNIVHQVFGMEANEANEKRDRTILITAMIKNVTKLQAKLPNYDFTNLEDGIHQLRRDARDIDNYPLAMAGLIAWDASTCPNPAWKNFVPSRPIDPIVPVKNPCNIPACLDGVVSNVQNTLAGIKQSAVEENASLGRELDFVSPEVLASAKAQRDRLTTAPRPLDLIRAQLQKCL